MTLLQETLLLAATLLEGKEENEHDLAPEERMVALRVYQELQRVLTIATKTEDTFARPQENSNVPETSFHDTFVRLKKEVKPRPLTRENLVHQNDGIFILDNSLRETTVGSVRGHTLEEKHKIVDALADTGLQEIILGAFGSKISVDSQIASRWRILGQSFDNTWGFSEAWDLDGFDEEPLWQSTGDFLKAKKEGRPLPDFWTPTQTVKTTYSEADLTLFTRAFARFPQPNVFSGKKPKHVLKESEYEQGRIPMGLLMMAGYGICNAIIEVDTAVETFDYQTYNLFERCKFLVDWCKMHLPTRQNVPAGQDNKARIFINCRDFVNYYRSDSGLENCLHLVDQLCRLEADQRPFGFLMEDPTGWLWPDEVGFLVRMIRETMDRAGHPQGKFLVHLHMYFGLAEACVLSAMCNGADGVWAALCKTGAQVGHACSTITAVNLYRAGAKNVATQFNLKKMCQAARDITAIVTHEECPEYEEVYGVHAFDAAFFMWNVPACRYALAEIMEELGVDERFIRLNEIALVSAIERAMIYHFGESETAGWDPKHCPQMWNAIVNHLVTGISRNYNTPLGLGKLYGLVSREPLPAPMVRTMLESSKVADSHPTVIEFVQRWNRLCAKFQGEEAPSPICTSKSIMLPGIDVTLTPRLNKLPFEFYWKDFDQNPLFAPLPKLLTVARRVTLYPMMLEHHQQFQNTKNPMMYFEERILSLKLFIEEAASLGVLPLVDDFELRMHVDFFFGEGDWVNEINGERPKTGTRTKIRGVIEVCKKGGNHSILRAARGAIRRLEANAGIRDDMQHLHELIDFKLLGKALEKESEEDRAAIADHVADYYDAIVSSPFGLSPDDLESCQNYNDETSPFGDHDPSETRKQAAKANKKRTNALKNLKRLLSGDRKKKAKKATNSPPTDRERSKSPVNRRMEGTNSTTGDEAIESEEATTEEVYV